MTDVITVDGKQYIECNITEINARFDGSKKYQIAYYGDTIGYAEHFRKVFIGLVDYHDEKGEICTRHITELSFKKLMFVGDGSVGDTTCVMLGGKVSYLYAHSLDTMKLPQHFMRAYCDMGGINECLVEIKPIPKKIGDDGTYEVEIATDRDGFCRILVPKYNEKTTYTREEVIEAIRKSVKYCTTGYKNENINRALYDFDNWAKEIME